MKRRSSNVEDHELECLSEEDSLSMLAHDALDSKDFTGYPDLKMIGLEIVKKCKGLPLAIKALGGLLRTRVDCDAWKIISESDIWDLPPVKNNISPALWLSYYYLPSQLKQCFAYCSLIPKDYEFYEEEIVLLWMAEGFLRGANIRRKIEDLGRMHFQELVSRSFFQASSMDKSRFVMHDLINDLAQFVGGEIYFKIEKHEERKLPSLTRHSSYLMGYLKKDRKLETFFEAKSLRTFLPFQILQFRDGDTSNEGLLSKNVLNDLLARLKCLRVLSLKRYKISEIPDSIGNLRHLRYLDFSYNMIKRLPDSICTLYNLETLLLECCWIEKLPSKIGILKNLCHLDISPASRIKEMPSGVGKLTNLCALSNFIVGQGDALNIREMQNLPNLKGKLFISELQNVNDPQDAGKACLSSKSDLSDLNLEWSMDFNENLRKKEVETKVLEFLKPDKQLKTLAIKNYAGIAFPNWIEDPSYKNLRSLRFENCRNCTLLPAVGKLPLLKYLYISGMRKLTSVGNEFYGENWSNVFQSLETLHFQDMPEWEEWKACEVDDQARTFYCLRDLRIMNCPKLVGTLPRYLPSLKKLKIHCCQKLAVSISNLPMLCELKIDGCEKVVVGSSIDIWSVKDITLSNISEFECVTREMMMFESMKVENLTVRGCLWLTEWKWLMPLRSLHNLVVENCEGFVELPKTLHNFTCLGEMKIVNSPELASLLPNYLPLTVKSLEIRECEKVQCLLEDGENIKFFSESLLESLKLFKCKALISLSSSNKLPVKLKTLEIEDCPELEFVAQEIGDNNCLESVRIVRSCKNILYLPQGKDLFLSGCEKLEALPSLFSLQLQRLTIWDCPRVISIPQGGLPINLKTLMISDPKISKAIMEWGLHELTSLTSLSIRGGNCKVAVSFPERGLPTNLTWLDISGPNFVKAIMEWGLQKLTSLTYLRINGSGCKDVVSFPQKEIKLPYSLKRINISGFKRLRKLSFKGFQYVSFLEHLYIRNCPNLKYLPKKEILCSLSDLQIINCPLLEKRCKRYRGKYRSLLANIPDVYINSSKV